jgi:uncharacterized protein (DUF302 family)
MATTATLSDTAIERTIEADFPTTLERVKAALQREGFGVLSEIDLKAKLKEKLGVDFKPYVILGACHPPTAYKGVSMDEGVGVIMPCNVVVHAAAHGTAVKAVRPMATLKMFRNPSLEALGSDVEAMLRRAVESV